MRKLIITWFGLSLTRFVPAGFEAGHYIINDPRMSSPFRKWSRQIWHWIEVEL
jgi:hypothetical protein